MQAMPRQFMSLPLIPALLAGGIILAAPETDRGRGTDGDQPPAASRNVLVRVNDVVITEGELELLLISRGIPEELRPQVRERFLNRLVDRRLMQAYLAKRKAIANPQRLDLQVANIRKRIHESGHDPDELLSRLGLTEKDLREELALSLAWQVQLHRMVSDERLREYFQKHRNQFDGTQLRARVILLKVDEEKSVEGQADAIKRLQEIRKEITSGQITFAEAAAKYSQAPSSRQGGDIGYFTYRGKMPELFTRVVFDLKPGALSEPFNTPFGVQLAVVTEVKPGELSLEDERATVLRRLSDELWRELVSQQRADAKIERLEQDAP